jgi:hypothetical protein
MQKITAYRHIGSVESLKCLQPLIILACSKGANRLLASTLALTVVEKGCHIKLKLKLLKQERSKGLLLAEELASQK